MTDHYQQFNHQCCKEQVYPMKQRLFDIENLTFDFVDNSEKVITIFFNAFTSVSNFQFKKNAKGIK